jgi:hypothetical protein
METLLIAATAGALSIEIALLARRITAIRRQIEEAEGRVGGGLSRLAQHGERHSRHLLALTDEQHDQVAARRAWHAGL